MKHPPKLVCALCYGHDGWIVGGATRDREPRDYDVLIPFSNWQAAAFLIPSGSVPNSFGGFKCQTTEGVEVDVWPGDIGKMMTFDAVTDLWHPRTNFKWKRA